RLTVLAMIPQAPHRLRRTGLWLSFAFSLLLFIAVFALLDDAYGGFQSDLGPHMAGAEASDLDGSALTIFGIGAISGLITLASGFTLALTKIIEVRRRRPSPAGDVD